MEVKEYCPHCQNIVVGEFSPSEIRKWLTALAKKGGMKAVLTAAGSVIPGFGNVSGFIAGTAIDIIYGKDINKLVDYVADQFDDNKIYTFTCPKCGNVWMRNEDELSGSDTESETTTIGFANSDHVDYLNTVSLNSSETTSLDDPENNSTEYSGSIYSSFDNEGTSTTVSTVSSSTETTSESYSESGSTCSTESCSSSNSESFSTVPYEETHNPSPTQFIDLTDIFNKRFELFKEQVEGVIEDEALTDKLCNEMTHLGKQCESIDSITASKYFYLAGYCNLRYAAVHYPDSIEGEYLNRAYESLHQALMYLDSDEYKLMLSATETLRCASPEICVQLGTINTESYHFNNPTLFKKSWLKEFYEICRYNSLVTADEIIKDDENDKYSEELGINLWKSGLLLHNPRFKMGSNLNLFLLYEDDVTNSGKLSLRAANSLNAAFETFPYKIIKSLTSIDVFYGEWLESCVYFAESIIENKNPIKPQDIQRGVMMLCDISELEDCYAKECACETLGKYCEEGIYVQQNLPLALKYYEMAECEDDIARVKKLL